MRRDIQRMQDVLDAITTIREHPVSSREEYDADVPKRWLYLKHIEIVGEAMWKMQKDIKARYPETPWAKISGMRHILVHDYWEVDWDLIWRVLIAELDPLFDQVQRMIHDSAEV